MYSPFLTPALRLGDSNVDTCLGELEEACMSERRFACWMLAAGEAYDTIEIVVAVYSGFFLIVNICYITELR